MIQKQFFVLVLSLFLSFHSNSQTTFPGGVTGAETWYIVNHADYAQGLYRNSSDPYIRLQACPDNQVARYLFNFNPSFRATKLCLSYFAPLDISTSRNVFFVGEAANAGDNFSHLTTAWRSGFPSFVRTDSIIRNRFDLANKNVYVNKKIQQFTSDNNANVNFYNWNNYVKNKNFKSYGQAGETAFYIGRAFVNPEDDAVNFQGNFPEFISFPFELNHNEKNRVESYLALKYGITLAQGTPYRNSKNVVFWNQANYTKFPMRVFGIGRDDISGLNQLQSESVHSPNYLIASVGTLEESNPIKQGLVEIENNHFIVYADNNSPANLLAPNPQRVRELQRVWLSQNTGEIAPAIPIYFKFNLSSAISQALTSNPGLKLWMLRDKYVNNQNVSDFSSQYVDYYQPSAMDGVQFGYFKDVYFDADNGTFDQFTFGVGPEMIVQARFELNDCDDEKIKTYIVITGGVAPYTITITNTGSYSQTLTSNTNTTAFEAIAPNTYTIHVLDSQGNEAQTELPVQQQQIGVDLGPDIVFNANQQSAILNAGTYVLDPTATYEWYLDGELLEHYASTLTVTEPGLYTVVVTNGNRMCQVKDEIRVSYNLTGTFSPAEIDCDDNSASFSITLAGGVPPYTTTMSGTNQTVNQVFDTNTFVFENIPFDHYVMTTTDSVGSVFLTNLAVDDPLEGIELDLLSQLSQYCSYISNPEEYINPTYLCMTTGIYLDASLDVTSNSVTYQWYNNGELMDITTPLVEIYQDLGEFEGDNEYTTNNTFTAVITNSESGCSIEQTFVLMRYYGIGAANAMIAAKDENRSRMAQPSDEQLSARIYPNPSASGATFYYELKSSQMEEGTVEIYSPTGALLKSVPINGKSNYTIPFSLITSGTYLVITRTNKTTLTNKVIIK